MSTARARRPPVHPVPVSALTHAGVLAVTGLVACPRTISGLELRAFPRVEQVEEFVGKDGEHVVRRWSGVLLLDVLASTQPLDTARYVRIGAGSYALPLALTAAHAALICDELEGQPLTQQQGAPWRLLVPGAHEHTSVKWIDRLEVTAERGEAMTRAVVERGDVLAGSRVLIVIGKLPSRFGCTCSRRDHWSQVEPGLLDVMHHERARRMARAYLR